MLIWFFGLVIVLTLLVKFGMYIMGKRVGRQIADRHRDAEFIIETGQTPEHWPGSTNRLGRLDDLIGYFRTSPLVAEEPTREFLLNQLARVRREWTAK